MTGEERAAPAAGEGNDRKFIGAGLDQRDCAYFDGPAAQRQSATCFRAIPVTRRIQFHGEKNPAGMIFHPFVVLADFFLSVVGVGLFSPLPLAHRSARRNPRFAPVSNPPAQSLDP